jgi:hypothetical protein
MEMPPNLNTWNDGDRPTDTPQPSVPESTPARPETGEVLGASHAAPNPISVRRGAVQHARRLVRDPHYPPRSALRTIARLFAAYWPHE